MSDDDKIPASVDDLVELTKDIAGLQLALRRASLRIEIWKMIAGIGWGGWAIWALWPA